MRIKMKTPLAALLAALAVLLPTPAAHAAITLTGDTDPAPGNEPNINSTTTLTIGVTGVGSLFINGGDLASDFGYLGFNSGSTGTATVSAAGSTWTNSRDIDVGRSGTGELTIEAGGSVSNRFGDIGFFSGSQGTATVTGDGSNWINNGYLAVGNAGTGELTIEAGGSVSNLYGYLGFNSGSTGTATVTGAGSTWTNDAMYVGGNGVFAGGTGTLNVQDGGRVDVANTLGVWSTGTVDLTGGEISTGSFDNQQGGAFNFTGGQLTVTGGLFSPQAGSGTFSIDGASDLNVPTLALAGGATTQNIAELRVGDSGHGALRIEAGGSVSNTLGGRIGSNSGSSGAATVTGAGATWTNGDGLFVGPFGTGELNIEAGGSVSDTFGSLGATSGSQGTATVSGAGSNWTNGSFLRVGDSGVGALTISDGGSVSNTTGRIGFNSGSQGTATVSGAGSTWTNTDAMFVGTGTLNVEDGGRVEVANTLGVWSTGTVDLTGGEISTAGFDNQGAFNFTGGQLTVTGGLFSPQAGSGTFSINGASGLNVPTLALAGGATTQNIAELRVGDSGHGALRIEAGGTVVSTSGRIVGVAPVNASDLPTAHVTVTGAGSTWTNGDGLFVGKGGDLTIEASGSVSNTTGLISGDLRATTISDPDDLRGTKVTVTGAGSTWTNSGELRVGEGEEAHLNIANGGSVVSTHGSIGAPTEVDAINAMVTVTGAGSTWTNNGHLWVGLTLQRRISSRDGTGVVDKSSKSLVLEDLWHGRRTD
jgi:T5SS/PEP-CTERM-associated repeat protein